MDPHVKGYHFSNISQYDQFASASVTSPSYQQRYVAALPPNLLAQVLSYLDDVGDIARVARSSRLLHYMTNTRLYQQVILRSYPDIRYIDGRPEGFGGGSPFIVALHGLVTTGNATLVKDFQVRGEWNDIGIEEFDKGRVPDNSMMLNIIMRVAIDRMAMLRSFAWELDTKPLNTVYQSLALRPALISFTLRCPSKIVPRPAVIVPPMPNLRYLKITDIDPLCYPDDLSDLMLHARQLIDLRLHFSSRLRREADPSLNLAMLFGRLEGAGVRLPLKHVGFQNFFGRAPRGMDTYLHGQGVDTVTFLDSFGNGNAANPRTVYLDDLWKSMHPTQPTFRTVRENEMGQEQLTWLRSRNGLENFYYVNARSSSGTSPSHNDILPATSRGSPRLQPSPETRRSLAKDFVEALTHNHGSTLKHLLLSDDWPVDSDDLALIVQMCPHLEQLAFCFEPSDEQPGKLLLPFLPRLHAIRFLDAGRSNQPEHLLGVEETMRRLSRELCIPAAENLRLVGIADVVYKIGGYSQIIKDDGKVETVREVLVADKNVVKDVAVWHMDSLDLDVDPYPLFQ